MAAAELPLALSLLLCPIQISSVELNETVEIYFNLNEVVENGIITSEE